MGHRQVTAMLVQLCYLLTSDMQGRFPSTIGIVDGNVFFIGGQQDTQNGRVAACTMQGRDSVAIFHGN